MTSYSKNIERSTSMNDEPEITVEYIERQPNGHLSIPPRPSMNDSEETWQDYRGILHDRIQCLIAEAEEASVMITHLQLLRLMQKTNNLNALFPPLQ